MAASIQILGVRTTTCKERARQVTLIAGRTDKYYLYYIGKGTLDAGQMGGSRVHQDAQRMLLASAQTFYCCPNSQTS